jgi:spermidine synthase
LAIVLVIATTGLAYELALAAVASYYLGDTVTVFSLVIGGYLSALGAGAYLSRFVGQELALTFIDVQLSVAVLGGCSVLLCTLGYALTSFFPALLLVLVLGVGILVGIELPLLLRLLEERLSFRELVAKALGVDYVGSLLGSLGFSLLLLPRAGLLRTALLCGLLDALAALASIAVLARTAPPARLRSRRVATLVILALLAVLLLGAGELNRMLDALTHRGELISSVSSRHQRITLTRVGRAIELYLNGHLQFSSLDERRYHELLVHPALCSAERRERVFIGGGGDGLALREVLRYPEVSSVLLVDLDERVTRLAAEQPELAALNQRALSDPRVSVVNRDAFRVLAESRSTYDVILLDFPDPSNYALGKLFSLEMYRHVAKRLAPGGRVAVQAASPLFARRSFWSVVATLEAAGLRTAPYHAFLPSFGEWGFVLAARDSISPPRLARAPQLSFLSQELLDHSFVFPPDLARVPGTVNRLDNQVLVSLYVDEWSRWDAW